MEIKKLSSTFFLPLTFVAALLTAGAWATQSLLHKDFMSLEKAEKRWGKDPFIAEKFKSGNELARAKMAVSLISSKAYIDKPLSSVRKELGDPDGYFENDGIPAYIISPESNTGKELWQIIFIPDEKWERVKEVRIHKNCC